MGVRIADVEMAENGHTGGQHGLLTSGTMWECRFPLLKGAERRRDDTISDGDTQLLSEEAEGLRDRRRCR